MLKRHPQRSCSYFHVKFKFVSSVQDKWAYMESYSLGKWAITLWEQFPKPKRALTTTKVFQYLIPLLYAHSCNSLSVYFELFDFFQLVIYTQTVLTLFPQRTFQFTSHTVSFTLEEAYPVEAWYMAECLYIDFEKTMIKMYSWDDIAWFIIFLILYVYFISQDHDGVD